MEFRLFLGIAIAITGFLFQGILSVPIIDTGRIEVSDSVDNKFFDGKANVTLQNDTIYYDFEENVHLDLFGLPFNQHMHAYGQVGNTTTAFMGGSVSTVGGQNASWVADGATSIQNAHNMTLGIGSTLTGNAVITKQVDLPGPTIG